MWIQQLLLVYPQAAENLWMAIDTATGVLFFHTIVTTGLPHNLWSELVQPRTVITRAATQGQIRFGDNHRGTSEFIRSSFKYRVQRYYSKIPSDTKKLPLEVFTTKLKQYSFRNIPMK